MKAIVTILDDNDNVVEKDKVILPYKSDTYIVGADICNAGEGENPDRMLMNKYEFRFCFSTMNPFERRQKNE